MLEDGPSGQVERHYMRIFRLNSRLKIFWSVVSLYSVVEIIGGEPKKRLWWQRITSKKLLQKTAEEALGINCPSVKSVSKFLWLLWLVRDDGLAVLNYA